MPKGNIIAAHDEKSFSKLYGDMLKYFDIFSTFDLDRLIEAFLSSVMDEVDAQCIALWLASAENSDELALSTARGLVDMSAEVNKIVLSAGGAAEKIIDGKPYYEPADAGKNLNKDVFFVPLRRNEKVVGLIKIWEKLDSEGFDANDLSAVKAIADIASIALDNAVKIRDMQSLGFKELGTNTYHIGYFADHAEKEILKAKRYQRTFSVLYISIENYYELLTKLDEAALADVIKRFVNAVLSVIRDADIFAVEKNDEYYILLPETDYFGSLTSIRKIKRALAGEKLIKDKESSAELEISIRSASFLKDGDNLDDILKAVRNRMEDARKSIYLRYRLDSMNFWEIFLLLVGKGDYYPDALINGKAPLDGTNREFEDEEGMMKYVLFTPQMLSQIHDVIFDEIEMNPDNRGILYLGCRDSKKSLELLKKHGRIAGSATKIFTLGEREGNGTEFPGITHVFVSPEEIDDALFLLFLNVDYAYAVFLKERNDGMLYGFHTSDPIFVENVIAKLQEYYRLQVQL